MNMRYALVLLVLSSAPVLAHASCDAVKTSIDAKIKAHGVSDFTLDVVPASQAVTTGKVVGQCEGDKQIVYTKGAVTAAQPGEHATMDHAKAKPAMKLAPSDPHGKSGEPQPAMSSSSGG